nr:hypothetical protein [uncultured Marinifilum sp.]
MRCFVIVEAGNFNRINSIISSEYSNEETAEIANSGIVSLGGGVKVNYALGKKLSLQTGFIYNRFGQDLGGNNRVLAFLNHYHYLIKRYKLGIYYKL